MGSISCPHCKQRISSYLIDVLEGGGQLSGSGGLICAGCGAKLRHYEIEQQVRKELLTPYQETQTKKARGSGSGSMNWRLIFALSLFGVAMAIADLFGLQDLMIKPLLWLIIFVIYAICIARICAGKYFLHGFLVSLLNGIWIGLIHASFFPMFLRNNPISKELESLSADISPPRGIHIFVEAFEGALFGVVAGLFALIASRFLSKRAVGQSSKSDTAETQARFSAELESVLATELVSRLGPICGSSLATELATLKAPSLAVEITGQLARQVGTRLETLSASGVAAQVAGNLQSELTEKIEELATKIQAGTPAADLKGHLVSELAPSYGPKVAGELSAALLRQAESPAAAEVLAEIAKTDTDKDVQRAAVERLEVLRQTTAAEPPASIKDRQPIEVSLSNIKGISIGFVDFDPGSEAPQLALDLTQRWNPLIYQGLVTLRPNVDIRTFKASTLDGLAGLLKDHRDRNHPDCDVIFQSGNFQMLQKSTGTQTRVDVLLATYHRNQGGRMKVMVGDNFTLRPVTDPIVTNAPLKHYSDDHAGLSLDYPGVAPWTIQRPPEVNPPARVAFTNSETKATLVVGFLQLPNVIPDLSEPGILQAATDDILGSYRRKNPQARLVSSRIVTNAQNRVKGVEVVYTDSVGGEPWKGRQVAFFKGSKRYDVSAFALEDQFERADIDFFSVVLKTITF